MRPSKVVTQLTLSLRRIGVLQACSTSNTVPLPISSSSNLAPAAVSLPSVFMPKPSRAQEDFRSWIGHDELYYRDGTEGRAEQDSEMMRRKLGEVDG